MCSFVSRHPVNDNLMATGTVVYIPDLQSFWCGECQEWIEVPRLLLTNPEKMAMVHENIQRDHDEKHSGTPVAGQPIVVDALNRLRAYWSRQTRSVEVMQ